MIEETVYPLDPRRTPEQQYGTGVVHPHHDECGKETLRQWAARTGAGEPPAEIAEQILVKCHPDCPHLKTADEFGRQLAEQYGWGLRDFDD